MVLIYDQRRDKPLTFGLFKGRHQGILIFCFEDDLSTKELGALVQAQQRRIVLCGQYRAVLRRVARLRGKFTGRHFKIAAYYGVDSQSIALFDFFLRKAGHGCSPRFDVRRRASDRLYWPDILVNYLFHGLVSFSRSKSALSRRKFSFSLSNAILSRSSIF
jgi:hypothetical protein